MHTAADDGRPRARPAAVRALTVAAVLLAAFAWGLSGVVDEARTYAVVHGLTADTSRDEATTVVLLALAGALLLVAAVARRPRATAHDRRHG